MGIYTAILFSHKKEWNCAIWRDKDGHRDCIQSEVSQKKEKKILFVTHMWNLEKKTWYRWSHLQSADGNTEIEKKCGYSKGGKGGWDEWEIGINIYIYIPLILCIK